MLIGDRIDRANTRILRGSDQLYPTFVYGTRWLSMAVKNHPDLAIVAQPKTTNRNDLIAIQNRVSEDIGIRHGLTPPPGQQITGSQIPNGHRYQPLATDQEL